MLPKGGTGTNDIVRTHVGRIFVIVTVNNEKKHIQIRDKRMNVQPVKPAIEKISCPHVSGLERKAAYEKKMSRFAYS